MKDLCTTCLIREQCDNLCDKALEWVNQDQLNSEPMEVTTTSGEEWEMDLHSFNAEHNLLTLSEMFGGKPILGLLEWRIVRRLKLTDQQMECMWLYYWDDNTQDQVASKLNISQQVVQEHLQIARKKLYIELKKKQSLLKKINETELTSRQREIAELYYKWDTSQEKIAKKLGIAQPSVSRILKKVRKKAKL